jgi:hypothetical protein
MKAIVTTAAALALSISFSGAFSAPALAQQANEQVAVEKSGGQCAITQAMLAAIDDNKQQHMQATKSKIDLLIENALASSRAAKLAGSPVKLGKGSPDG